MNWLVSNVCCLFVSCLPQRDGKCPITIYWIRNSMVTVVQEYGELAQPWAKSTVVPRSIMLKAALEIHELIMFYPFLSIHINSCLQTFIMIVFSLTFILYPYYDLLIIMYTHSNILRNHWEAYLLMKPPVYRGHLLKVTTLTLAQLYELSLFLPV